MSKNKILAALIVLSMAVILVAGFIATDYGSAREPVPVPFDGGEGSINMVLFGQWGPVMLIIGAVMFGAIIAGVCLSKEEKDEGEEKK